VNFDLPADLVVYLAELDAFIASDIRPLEAQDDNCLLYTYDAADDISAV
jgi:acyl-CoA dehydrogenase